jgi:hypothetical protein
MGLFGIFNRNEPTLEQRERLDRIGNSHQRKAILAAIRAGKTIPESVWAPLPEGANIARLIDQENAPAGGNHNRAETPAASRIGGVQEVAKLGEGTGSTFALWTHLKETSLDRVGREEGLKTLFAWGIVNPFGPTLTAVATDGIIFAPGRKLPIVYVMLNPFQQEVQIVGEACIGQTWNALRDLPPLFGVRLGSCPTLLLPSSHREADEDVELYANLLSHFDDGSNVLEKVRRFPGDPWNRVKDDVDQSQDIMVKGIQRMRNGLDDGGDPEASGRRLSPGEARELASNLLQPRNLKAELQAFMYAWHGSIEFQESHGIGGMSKTALPLKEFAKVFALLAITCNLPEM